MGVGARERTMERRKFLIGAGSLAAGSAAAMGTGAFTSVEANRTVNVKVAGDANAYLGLSKTTDNSNSDYAEITTNGELQVNLDDIDESDASDSAINGSGEGGAGVNSNAITVARHVFKVKNNGNEAVEVDLSGSGDVNGGEPGDSVTKGVYFSFDKGDSDPDDTFKDYVNPTTADLDIGDEIDVGMEVITQTDSISGNLVIEANEDDNAEDGVYGGHDDSVTEDEETTTSS